MRAFSMKSISQDTNNNDWAVTSRHQRGYWFGLHIQSLIHTAASAWLPETVGKDWERFNGLLFGYVPIRPETVKTVSLHRGAFTSPG